MKDRELPEVLQACRKRAGMTQDELARKLFVDQAIISNAENGKLPIAYVLVKEWARVTQGEDLITLHLTGGKEGGWKKLRQLEQAFEKIKTSLDLVNFMKRRKKA